jgi:hypothetical protein
MYKSLIILILGAGMILAAAGCDRSPDADISGILNSHLRAPVSFTTGAIGDRVWLDANMDGLQAGDTTEPGLAGVWVYLYACNDTIILPAVPLALDSMMTNADGYYAFDSLTPGGYQVSFVLPEGYRFTLRHIGENPLLDSDADSLTGMIDCTVLDSGETDISWDAGMYAIPVPEYGSIGDLVWYDADRDGLQGDPMVEHGFGGVAVSLYTCTDTLVAATTTDTMGYYRFDEVMPGEYYLMFDLPDEYVFSMMDIGDNDTLDSDVDPWTWKTACFTLDSLEVDLTWDAGLMDAGCTRSKGYWKNHAGFGPQADVVTALLPIWLGDDDGDKSVAVVDAQIAYDLLSMKVYGEPANGITKLYAQLLAAKLNMADGASWYDIHETLAAADDFLADYDWMDWSTLDGEQRQMVLHWMGTLDQYNNGYIGPGHCYEDGDDYDDDDDDGQEAMR